MSDSPRYVYLLSNYAERGSEDVTATLNRDALPSLLEARLARYPVYDASLQREARERLAGLLHLSDSELSTAEDTTGHDLMRGWGGEMLHVVALSES